MAAGGQRILRSEQRGDSLSVTGHVVCELTTAQVVELDFLVFISCNKDLVLIVVNHRVRLLELAVSSKERFQFELNLSSLNVEDRERGRVGEASCKLGVREPSARCRHIAVCELCQQFVLS